MTLWIGNGAVLKSSSQWQLGKRILKINNSWPMLFNFQDSLNCNGLELLRTALYFKLV